MCIGLIAGYYGGVFGEIDWLDGAGRTKRAGSRWFCTTGASDQNRSLNIYDFIGNVGEFTLERYYTVDVVCAYTGGTFKGDCRAVKSWGTPISYTYGSNPMISSRTSLFIK